MVEEYGGIVQFAGLLVQSGVDAFLAAEQALQELPLTRSWGKTTVTLEPVGVAGLITAWNANALFICLKLASAVAAGCTVVIKPSELSSLQTQVLVEALHEADLPKGLLNVVTGRGNVVGAELVCNPHVANISFTGSVAVGETIMRDGAKTMKRVTLELGGKSPTILLDDAVLDKAIPSALVIYPAEPRKEPNFSYRLLRAIYPVFRMFSKQVIRTDDLAQVMVDVAVRGKRERENVVLENREIRAMAGSLHPTA
jgi:aldehyde dehydrogenase (NAD+)